MKEDECGMVGNAIQSILSLALLIGVGCFLETREWFKGGASILSKFCVNISIPCYMVYNIITVVPTRGELLDMAGKLPIPLIVMLTGIVASLLLVRIFKVDPKRRGVVVVAASFANTVFIGFPVVEGLFGDVGLPIAMVYYMMSMTLFWTVGVYLLRQDSDHPVRFFSLDGLKKILLAPPIVGLLIGIALVLTGITLPGFLFSSLNRVQGMTTPLAMIFVGSIVYSINFKELGLSKDLLIVMAMRFVGLPLVMWAVCVLLPIPLLSKQVFFSMASLPTMTQVSLMAKEVEGDYQFASLAVGLTTVVSILTVPVYAWIIENFALFS